MRRRDFLKAVAVGVGVLIVGCGDDEASGDGFKRDAALFPQSVASGDPTDTTVVLWTRLQDGAEDATLELQVALDPDFKDVFALGEGSMGLALTAEAAVDHCVKVRLEGLAASTYYYYRFLYEKDGETYSSNVGRTKTAPSADSDTPAKFGFVSCQDFNGKYFNSYKVMVQQDDIDFFVHLGDYVYETTGDPQFQLTTPDRSVVFQDPDGAIVFNEGTDDEFRAAKSLSNYRDLYKIYRSDEWLQRAHELFPCVAIWDDHEYSDDCFGATATYTDGKEDETDVPRRMAANQAWSEYMPVDYMGDPSFRYDPNATYGDDIRIYRDIRWGKNLHVVMTDLRSYRADHVIPEDLFPGKLLMTEDELLSELGEVPDWADPYVDIDAYDGGSLVPILTTEAGLPEADITGNLSATYVNGVIATLNESRLELLGNIPTDGLERGLTTLTLGKTGLTGQLGARYLVVEEPFGVWAKKLFTDTNGESERTMGDDQESWFLETMTNSDAVWKVWGNEFTLMQRIVDLSALGDTVGPGFAKKFLLSAEDWDGMRNKRDELLEILSGLDNVVAITGDIHAFFAGNPHVSDDTSKRIVEFVTGAVSSGSMKRLLINTANSDPDLAAAGATALAAGIESFLFADTKPNSGLGYAVTDEHGFSVIELDSSSLTCTFHRIPESNVGKDLEVAEAVSLFETTAFTVSAGSTDVVDEAGKKWDPDTAEWI